MKSMRIGEVARRSGAGIETIRYYEREGLLREPDRGPSGYRRYDEATVDRLAYIKRAKELGFTLSEIKGLLELSHSRACCEEVRRTAEAKIADIEARIASLQRMKMSLGSVLDRCRSGETAHDCPLLHGAGGRPADA